MFAKENISEDCKIMQLLFFVQKLAVEIESAYLV